MNNNNKLICGNDIDKFLKSEPTKEEMEYFSWDCNLESYFDGTMQGLIAIRTLCLFVNIITFGLAYPYMTCLQISWETKHTVINGNRLKFIGRGSQLILRYLKWWALTIATFGLYRFLIELKMKEWKIENTIIDFRCIE